MLNICICLPYIDETRNFHVKDGFHRNTNQKLIASVNALAFAEIAY